MSDWRGEHLIRGIKGNRSNDGALASAVMAKAGVKKAPKHCRKCKKLLKRDNTSGLCKKHYAEVAAKNLPKGEAK